MIYWYEMAVKRNSYYGHSLPYQNKMLCLQYVTTHASVCLQLYILFWFMCLLLWVFGGVDYFIFLALVTGHSAALKFTTKHAIRKLIEMRLLDAVPCFMQDIAWSFKLKLYIYKFSEIHYFSLTATLLSLTWCMCAYKIK